jgi:hypothetical protein
MFSLTEYVYFISSYYILVEQFQLKQIQKVYLEKKGEQNDENSKMK